MIKIVNSKGTIQMSGNYFAAVAGTAAQSCYGVVGMENTGTGDSIKGILFGKNFCDKGVKITESGGALSIELHIAVLYGLNIQAIVKSIINKVSYAVENVSGVPVTRVDVVVEKIVEE